MIPLTWRLELARWKPGFLAFRIRCWWYGRVRLSQKIVAFESASRRKNRGK